MGVTVYSVIISVLFYNLSLIAVFLLCRSGAIRAKYTSALLLFLTLLGVIRLLAPIDFDKAYVIRSYTFLPAIENWLSAPLLGSLSLGNILLLVWAAGTVTFVLRDFVKLRCDHLESELLEMTDNERISRIAEEFEERFTLRISPEIDIPYVTGLRSSVIYVPDIELSDEEWRNIFRHETQHIHAHDEWKKLFFRAFRAIFWWNPLLRLSEDDISLLIELQCDARVAGKGNRDEQEGYLRTMMELMRRYAYEDATVGTSRMVGKQKEMKIRFQALLTPETKRSKWMRVVMPVLMVIMFMASYLVIVQPARFPSDEEITFLQEGYTVNDITDDIEAFGDNYIVYDNGEYQLFLNGEYAFRLDKSLLSDPQFCELPIIGGE